jgi:hypothetical protein
MRMSQPCSLYPLVTNLFEPQRQPPVVRIDDDEVQSMKASTEASY